MTRLTFLGTGGGRFCTIFQKRATGGLVVSDRGLALHLDPGPGALVRMQEANLDPTRTDALLVSHAHVDHASDANVLAKALTRGGLDRRGALIAARSVTQGARGFGPAMDPHHLQLLAEVHEVEAGDQVLVKDWYSVKATRAQHTDPTTVGFQIVLSEAVLSYVPDTSYFEGLAAEHRGSDVLVIEAARPHHDHLRHHLAADQAAKVIRKVRPRLAILDLFGMKMLAAGPETAASRITKETGIPTIAATDGMEVDIGEEVQVRVRARTAARAEEALPPRAAGSPQPTVRPPVRPPATPHHPEAPARVAPASKTPPSVR